MDETSETSATLCENILNLMSYNDAYVDIFSYDVHYSTGPKSVVQGEVLVHFLLPETLLVVYLEANCLIYFLSKII